MVMTEDEIIERYGETFMHFTQNTLLPYEYEWTCSSCGHNYIN